MGIVREMTAIRDRIKEAQRLLSLNPDNLIWIFVGMMHQFREMDRFCCHNWRFAIEISIVVVVLICRFCIPSFRDHVYTYPVYTSATHCVRNYKLSSHRMNQMPIYSATTIAKTSTPTESLCGFVFFPIDHIAFTVNKNTIDVFTKTSHYTRRRCESD